VKNQNKNFFSVVKAFFLLPSQEEKAIFDEIFIAK
jgi:hypothetical protein